MKHIYITTILLIGTLTTHASTFYKSEKDLDLLKNDKEVISRIISKKEKKNIIIDTELVSKYKDAFFQATRKLIERNKTKCELNLISLFKENLESYSLDNSKLSIDNYLKQLRISNFIDDIYLDTSLNLNDDYHALKLLNPNKKIKLRGLNNKYAREVLQSNKTTELYQNFTDAEEDIQCLYSRFSILKFTVKIPKNKKINNKERLKALKVTNLDALKKKLITKTTFQSIEYLRKKSFITKRKLRLRDYYDIIFGAKNKMKTRNSNYNVEDINLEEDEFSTNKLRWYKKLTQRTKLYQKYDVTQIILMAQVLQKASWRMGVDPDVTANAPVITQSFVINNADGTKENYVEKIELDTQSQYNLARKRMRKDIHDLQMMSTFIEKKIFYEEVVMAAFETGYVTIEDINYVVRYDDLWNPSKTKFERITGYIFRFTGLSLFFVPPPFNVAATIGLSIVEGIVKKLSIKGEDNDHAATFIN